MWGRELAGTLIPVEYAAGAFRVDGFVQRPGDAQPTGRRTQLFVNGRPFKDPFLVRAAEAGYRSAIHPGDRPSVSSRIEAAPEDVDVNVHPAKLEVRFRDRIGVERVVEEAVRACARRARGRGAGRRLAAAPGRCRGARMPSAGSTSCSPRTAPRPDGAGAGSLARRPLGFHAPLLQLFDTYILYQGPEGIVIVDQHSAHERVLFEAVMAQLTGADAPAQRLLLPLTVELTDEELDAVEPTASSSAAWGSRSRHSEDGRWWCMRCRRPTRGSTPAPASARWWPTWRAAGSADGPTGCERFAATYACRAAVKAGESLSEREMRELLLRLFATDLPPHDVHGRATIVQLPREELERRFGRR